MSSARARHAGHSTTFVGGLLAVLSLVAVGCVQKMNDEPKYRSLAESDFFANGQAARPVPAGTVAHGQLRVDRLLYEGRVGDAWADSFPFPVTAAVLERGRQRYEIFCSPCHGRLGDGQGIVVQRGLRGPVSFQEKRFREYPAGYFFDVITNGRGAMYPYGYRVPVEDRWNIIAYIRALQLSQNATRTDLTPEEIRKLEEQPQ